MAISNLLTVALVALPLVAGLSFQSPTIKTDLLSAKGLVNLGLNVAFNGYPGPTCNLFNTRYRREWNALSNQEKKQFITAVQCLTKKPSKYSSSAAPGAKSRYDDFVATHINQSLSIHATANFLTWHRYFIWAFEKALQDECGFPGTLPYWNWAKFADNPIGQPLFDGSDYSIGGNGEYFAHDDTTTALPGWTFPAGEGGGCVKTGPMKDWTVNLGPASATLFKNGSSYVEPNPRADGMGYNPRCLRRDISKFSAQYTTDTAISDLITGSNNVYWFQYLMQGGDFTTGIGIHTGGHFTIGGDPGGDFFASPGEPAFWLHHAQIDRIWWIWQNQDIKNRQYAVSGTITFYNNPPSRNGTMEDTINLGPSGADITLRDAMHTLGGKFCYIYI